jgi:hypothetical protein
MVDLQTISITVASASVMAGVIYYAFQIRHSVKARQMDLLMRLYLTWGSEDMKKSFQNFLAMEFKDWDDFKKKYGRPSQAFIDLDKVGWFFNGLGFLVHRRFADTKQVDELFGYGVIFVWEKMKPAVEGWRNELNIPKSYAWLEYLYNEMKKREQRQ